MSLKRSAIFYKKQSIEINFSYSFLEMFHTLFTLFFMAFRFRAPRSDLGRIVWTKGISFRFMHPHLTIDNSTAKNEVSYFSLRNIIC